MEKQQFLLRFVYLDGNSSINDVQYLIAVPASLTLRQVKLEISRCHKKLREDADYAESLDLVPEENLSEEEKRLVEDAEENNPYYFVPAVPDALLRYVCAQNPEWSFHQARDLFNLSDGTWVS